MSYRNHESHILILDMLHDCQHTGQNDKVKNETQGVLIRMVRFLLYVIETVTEIIKAKGTQKNATKRTKKIEEN